VLIYFTWWTTQAGTPINKKVSAENVFNNIPSWLGLKQSSQSITGDGSTTTAVNVTTAITDNQCNFSNRHSITLADGSDGQIKSYIMYVNIRYKCDCYNTFKFRWLYKHHIKRTRRKCTFVYLKILNWYIIGGNGYVLA
jgi:hypothetical protein